PVRLRTSNLEPRAAVAESASPSHTFQFASHAARTHGPCNLDDLVHGQVATVFDVLHLLSVASRLLQRLDDQRGGGRDHCDGRLSVLNDQLAGDLEAFPVGGGLGNVITDLFRRQTKGTDFGSERRGGTYLTTNSSQVDWQRGWQRD